MSSSCDPAIISPHTTYEHSFRVGKRKCWTLDDRRAWGSIDLELDDDSTTQIDNAIIVTKTFAHTTRPRELAQPKKSQADVDSEEEYIMHNMAIYEGPKVR